MVCMSHDKIITNLKTQIRVTEQRLEMLKRHLRQLEKLADLIEYKALLSFDDFPRNVNLWRSITYNASQIMGRERRDAEEITVEHLIRMSPKAILKYKGVGPGIMKRLEEWMNRHNLSFASESRLLYAPIGEDEILSTFNHLWDAWLKPSTIRTLNAGIEKIANRQGKHYYNAYNYYGFPRYEGERESKPEENDNYTMGDFLRINLAELQEKCGFDDLTIQKIKECMEEHGLEFINE